MTTHQTTPHKRPTVLFATDLDGDVDEGLRVASKLAAERSATLVIAHVVPLRARDGEGMLYSSADAEAQTRAVLALRPPDPMVAYVSTVLVGEIESELAGAVQEYGAGLMVLESRPRTRLARLLGRGLSDRLRERIHCPIVTYRPRPRSVRSEQTSAKPSEVRAPFSSLEALLDARVEALVDWLDAQGRTAITIAGRSSIRGGVMALMQTPPKGGATTSARVSSAKVLADLTLRLREQLWATQALGVDVWIGGAVSDGTVPASNVLSLGHSAPASEERDAWMRSVIRDGCAVSLPMPAAKGQSPVVLAGARVTLPGEQPAVLGLALDASRGFLRILGQPGPAASAETYAIDQDGYLRSYSRFPAHLRRMGIRAEAHQLPDRVRVCDPGNSLFAARASDSLKWPLTRMAQSATEGSNGSDRVGYHDYRGVMVVGAWRWIPRYRCGVAAEMDASDTQAA